MSSSSSSSADGISSTEPEDPQQHNQEEDPTGTGTASNSGNRAPKMTNNGNPNDEPVRPNNNNNKKRNFSQAHPPITADGEQPQKRFYRQRAHCNPLSHNDSYDYPVSPNLMQWTNPDTGWFYPVPAPPAPAPAAVTLSSDQEQSPTRITTVHPTVLDIGCGFGGLTMALAQELPHETILGLEIRAKVTEYVRLRIVAARRAAGSHTNAAVLRTNSMKFLVHYFAPASLCKLFICFPDPHFKRKNHPRRIVTTRLLDEYAYVLSPQRQGKLYCITDVRELHDWHVAHCDAHPLFRRVVVSTEDNHNNNQHTTAADADADPCVALMIHATEEGQKVERNQGEKFYAVYERIPDAEAEAVHAGNFFA